MVWPQQENDQLTNTQDLTMSSREIAELTGKRHDNVLVDIRSMLDTLGEDSLRFQEKVPTRGRPTTLFHLPKDLTITLIAGYRADLRHRIVVRWMELEEQASKPQHQIPQSFAEALSLAARLEEERVRLEHVVTEQAPKVEAFDTFMETTTTFTTTDAAKALGFRSAQALNSFMKTLGSCPILTRRMPAAPAEALCCPTAWEGDPTPFHLSSASPSSSQSLS